MQIFNWDTLLENLGDDAMADVAEQFLFDSDTNYGYTGSSLVEGHIIYELILDAIDSWCEQEGLSSDDGHILVSRVPLRLCDEDAWVEIETGDIP